MNINISQIGGRFIKLYKYNILRRDYMGGLFYTYQCGK